MAKKTYAEIFDAEKKELQLELSKFVQSRMIETPNYPKQYVVNEFYMNCMACAFSRLAILEGKLPKKEKDDTL